MSLLSDILDLKMTHSGKGDLRKYSPLNSFALSVKKEMAESLFRGK